ncbi:hypothetical protein Sango_2671500 [Sesamum angolense]|uniref:Mitochondrial glycoprotein n=1 Tax=Sesamum angolense TaxID=2727404 RepID=A0AAE2BHG1_9LAMI|nr:hypothetical protein Sango_2671500 [Sesamum angolense]
MWRKALVCAGGAVQRRMLQPWRTLASRSSSTASYAVNSMILRSLKDHYLEVSKMTLLRNVEGFYGILLWIIFFAASLVAWPVLQWRDEKISPPSPYTVVKGALDSGGPVLRRTFQDEEINISVMRLVDIIPGGSGDDSSDDSINQLFVHVDISKPGLQESLHFLCGLYPDALGIHSVSLRPKAESSGSLVIPTKYNGPVFEFEMLHGYIEERGINESLFPFLQAWLYVKDHRDLMRWFKTVGSFVNETNQGTLQA